MPTLKSLEDIAGFYMNKQTMVRIKPRKYVIAWNSRVLVWSVVEAKSRSSCKVPHPKSDMPTTNQSEKIKCYSYLKCIIRGGVWGANIVFSGEFTCYLVWLNFGIALNSTSLRRNLSHFNVRPKNWKKFIEIFTSIQQGQSLMIVCWFAGRYLQSPCIACASKL